MPKQLENVIHSRVPIFNLKIYDIEECIELYHALKLFYDHRHANEHMVKIIKELQSRLMIDAIY